MSNGPTKLKLLDLHPQTLNSGGQGPQRPARAGPALSCRAGSITLRSSSGYCAQTSSSWSLFQTWAFTYTAVFWKIRFSKTQTWAATETARMNRYFEVLRRSLEYYRETWCDNIFWQNSSRLIRRTKRKVRWQVARHIHWEAETPDTAEKHKKLHSPMACKMNVKESGKPHWKHTKLKKIINQSFFLAKQYW